MKWTGLGSLWVSAALMVLSGCQSVRGRGAFHEVQEIVRDKGGLEISSWRDPSGDAEIQKGLEFLLADKLGIDGVTQIALLNNRELQAEYEELHISEADLVQAGLMKNPVFSGSVRFPDRSPSGTNIGLSVVQDFLDVLVIPVRKRLSERELDQAIFRVAHEVLDLAVEVRARYFELQAREQSLELQREMLTGLEGAEEFAAAQHQAGNVTDSFLFGRRAEAHGGRIGVVLAEEEVQLARHALERLMGLDGGSAEWSIAGGVPELPEESFELAGLEAEALEGRSDLKAVRVEKEIIAGSLSLTKAGLPGMIEVGIDSERDPGRTVVTGPSISFELPIFDRKQAAITRHEAQMRQAEHRLAAMESTVRYEVRVAWERTEASRKVATALRDGVVPLRERIVLDAQARQMGMILGAYDLLDAKVEEIAAQLAYVEALEDYWVGRCGLEGAVGRLLPTPGPRSRGTGEGETASEEGAASVRKAPAEDAPAHHEHMHE